MNDLKLFENPFQFTGLDIRTAVDEHNEPWFCAKDVCAAMDISWSGAGNTLRSLPDTWVMVWNIKTIKGERETRFISEKGIYKLIFRSNKPKAVEFTDWVCEEVLPQIRKHGFYGVVQPKDYVALVKQIAILTKQIATTESVFEREALVKPLRTLYNMAGHRMPDVKLLANGTNKSNQSDLFGPEQEEKLS